MFEQSEVKTVKIVLVGEPGVGKTNIITKYVDNYFDPNSGTTHGASFSKKTIRYEDYNTSLQMHLWDTAGQEHYKSLTRIFYKDTIAAILVYDITKRKSFEEVKKYWCKELLEKAPSGVVLGLAANKSDLILDAQVTEDEGIQFAKSINAVFRNTSALTADGIEDLFLCLGKKMLDPSYNEFEEQKKINENQRKTITNPALLNKTDDTRRLDDPDKRKDEGWCC